MDILRSGKTWLTIDQHTYYYLSLIATTDSPKQVQIKPEAKACVQVHELTLQAQSLDIAQFYDRLKNQSYQIVYYYALR
ncbi:hypothetical protein [Sphingobacterium sp.]|uniref:hypothetical protein n=1 Tax=Sphingobacterium sp. TaxID=341027 RepID=UPI0028992202|nr:hypothetical protein [Sphingobacterium sp.]